MGKGPKGGIFEEGVFLEQKVFNGGGSNFFSPFRKGLGIFP